MGAEGGGEEDPILRVVQWATGRIGRESLRAVLRHPRLSLVGVHAYSAEKAGMDAGELCGLERTGVRATQDIDEILALKPDCVLYMPRVTDDRDLCRLLASGANVVVVTTRGEFYRPDSMESDLRQRLEAACDEGVSSLHSTGSSPGFITEALPVVLTSLQRRLDCLTINEFGDLSQYNSSAMVFDTLGFGRLPAEFDAEGNSHVGEIFGPSIRLLADALSIPLDSVEQESEIALARRPVEILTGRLEAGSVAAQRHTVSAIRAGKPVLRFRLYWYCTKDIDQPWPLGDSGWRVSVEGDVPMEVEVGLPVPLEQLAVVGPSMAAHRAVNSIIPLCEASAGIRTSLDFPPVRAQCL